MATVDMQTMYDEHAKPVYRYLLGLCSNEHDAEELTAETFYRALKSIDRYNGECQLQTWLFQIAKHVWYQELEKRKRKTVSIEVAEPIADPTGLEESVVSKESKLELYRRMQKLDDITREVIYLRLSGELSFNEIGEILGKNENWARVTFYRGKERMKTYGG